MNESFNVHTLISAVSTNRIEASSRFKAIERSDQVDLVRSASVEQRYDIITLLDDARPLVEALSVPDLYVLVSHEDMNSRVQSLLEVATPEQLRGVMDFAVWNGDEPDEDAVLDWFEWLMSLPDDTLADRIRTLDPAFLATVLGPHLEVCPEHTPGEFTVIATKIDALPTAFEYDDAMWEWFVYRLYEVDLELFDETMNRIFRDEWTEYRGTKRSLSDQLGEAAHLRARRLRDLELGDTYESRVDLLQPLEIHLPKVPHIGVSDLPVTIPVQSIFDRVINAATEPEVVSRWRISFARLSSDVVMARKGNPANRRDLERASDFAKSSLSVALDTLAGGCESMAYAIAMTWDWRDLFRVGNTLLERLRWRVDSIDQSDVPDGDMRVELSGLFRTPMRVIDPHTGEHRLPLFANELARAHRMIHEIQMAKAETRRVV